MIRRVAIITLAAFSAIVAGIEGWWNAAWDWDFPPPPPWLLDFTVWFFAHALEPMYWLLATVSLSTWVILWQQKRPNERGPARWLRRVSLAKGMLWLGLAFGRIWSDWRQPVYVITTMIVAIISVIFLITLTTTYLWPAIRKRPGPPGGLEGDVLPDPTYAGQNRRSRRPGRRRTDFA